MDLPSFLWLWRFAAWSMGLSLTAYGLLAISGLILWGDRRHQRPRPPWLAPVHRTLGISLVVLVLFLLAIGLIGTLGYYGSLGHSWHLPAGVTVVLLVLTSAWSGWQIHPKQPQMRRIHITCNLLLALGFLAVSWSGWTVVQKYLPP
ncbi:DUF4079 domain-containing protein [Sodalinema gerasimenkoae]|uniref:DUF4079 domain-containing protein n=1 Tax=Sodalinema gerasimenkoae TaxID=2862348 RepID=UPI00135A6844|nr:DUF4079 domain-containing protein [Sodalinema gerasimenkoae]